MIDMGQADRSLYRTPTEPEHKMPWLFALGKAAQQMGFEHYMDVPDARIDEAKALARDIRAAH